MVDDRALQQFARAAEEHAWTLARRRAAAIEGGAEVALWDAMVADAAARRYSARHALMKKLIAAERDESGRRPVL